jgi:glyoxylase-like metal-dependent hydrolase (beta-lactamase superfamily II)
MGLVLEEKGIRIEKFVLGPYGTNCYIIVCPLSGESVLIDAPAEEAKLLDRLKGTHPKHILITHNHMDHLLGLSRVRSKLKISVAIHPLDSKALFQPAEVLLSDGDVISFGRIRLKVIHTPGHTPGSLCFLIEGFLISGDTLFPGGPGKTHTPSDLHQIIESITTKLFVLPDETQILPGHGDSTLLKKEKAGYAVFASRSHDPNLFGDVLWLSS